MVARLWERQHFDPAALDQLGLRVVFRGLPSDAGGPDYQDAILCTSDGQLLQGDIEFHVRASDWYAHGHHREMRFSRVVLHVVWCRDANDTTRCDGVRVPTLELRGQAAPDTGAPLSGDVLLPHACVARYAALSADDLAARIAAAGAMRLAARADQLAAEMTVQHPDQVAYAALLEGLGYASNRDVFRQLADAAPYAWLMSLEPDLREACLLDASGLGPPSSLRPPVRFPRDSWRLARLRPANHPTLRLRGVAVLLRRLGPSLSSTVLAEVESVRTAHALRDALVVRGQDGTYIGPGRADELVASVMLPLALALSPHSSRPFQLFAASPCPPSNRWTRYVQQLLQQAGHAYKPSSAQEHQGLHFLYQRFCRIERRSGCPVCDPAQVRGHMG